MAPKRRASSNEVTPMKKMKKETYNHTPDEYREFFNSTLDLVFHLKDGDEELSSIFVKLPSKKFYLDYYHIVDQPISLNEIQKRIRTRYTAESADEFIDDFELLLHNAKTYNAPDSWIVSSAAKIVEFVKDQVREFETTPGSALPAASSSIPAEDTGAGEHKKPRIKLKLKQKQGEAAHDASAHETEPPITFGKLAELCLEVLDDVVNHEFPEIGVISGPFIEEVDTDFYSDYLDFVTKPMSFNTIIGNLEKKKLLSPKYPLLDNLQKFHDTTSLIFANARAYNNEDSQIYQDATMLEEYFNEKYDELKTRIENNSARNQQAGPKLKLNLHKAAAAASPPRRKKKTVLKVEPEEPKEEDEDEGDGHPEETKEGAAEDAEGDGAETDKHREIIAEQSTVNTMGKTAPLLPEGNAIIQESAIFSSPAVSTNVTKFVQQKFSSPVTIVPRDQEIKKALFPTQQTASVATLFSYKVPSNGYTNQSYTVALPNGVLPFVSFKVSLHNLLYQVKKRDLVDDHGFLNQPASEDFQCKLSVNEEEVTGVVDCFKEEKDEEDILGVQYDVRLSYGLNVLTFDCKVAPALSKRIKNTVVKEEEVAGRHTRHQVQQMQKSWDVESITFYVVCSSG
ncbi:Protein polybromo-1 [Candida viswanathii]|uniref:Protein polybromo-1 n=1 Tax=Candida viswanathii TaxID=5486 RepID=A0A367XLF7_9ASCO|nr:Protein polybromo-1 [Candida viswanathii]